MDIGIVGCAGRMGRMLAAQVSATDGARFAGGTERPGSDAVGQDIGPLAGLGPVGIHVGDDSRALFETVEAVIDFTAPAATAEHADLARKTGTALVVGTTGLGAEEDAKLEAAAANAAVVRAANFSLGVNLLLGLTEQVSAALDADFDIEIIEMHHRHKVDAPSGTALALGEAAAKGRSVDLSAVSQRVRDGHTGPRRRGDIGFATLRGGGVVGDHTVVFAAEAERIEITHRAASRAVFAAGAVHSAMWTEGRVPGLYSMRDVLGLS